MHSRKFLAVCGRAACYQVVALPAISSRGDSSGMACRAHRRDPPHTLGELLMQGQQRAMQRVESAAACTVRRRSRGATVVRLTAPARPPAIRRSRHCCGGVMTSLHLHQARGGRSCLGDWCRRHPIGRTMMAGTLSLDVRCLQRAARLYSMPVTQSALSIQLVMMPPSDSWFCGSSTTNLRSQPPEGVCPSWGVESHPTMHGRHKRPHHVLQLPHGC